MTDPNICPVCRGIDRAYCRKYRTNGDSRGFECERCGTFEVSGTALASEGLQLAESLPKVRRAALSHVIRLAQHEFRTLLITGEWLATNLGQAKLPPLTQQVANLIRVVGDHTRDTGEPYPIDLAACALVGTVDQDAMGRLVDDLKAAGLLKAGPTWQSLDLRPGQQVIGGSVILTLAGAKEYELGDQAPSGVVKGFIALKFNDGLFNEVLDRIKPTLERNLGHLLFDMREVSRAGIIDQIMREEIRNSDYMIADLTDDNCNVYWEAGFADALGKPVIYVCETAKFERAQSHFDTNHLTTVVWSMENLGAFEARLVDTIKRSLAAVVQR